MKRWVGLAALVFVGVAGWRLGDVLSSDAVSMAVGVLFGVIAGVPTALLLTAGGRRHEGEREEHRYGGRNWTAEAMSDAHWAEDGAYGTHGYGTHSAALQEWGPVGYRPNAARLRQADAPLSMPQPPVIILTTPQATGAQAQRAGVPTGWSPDELSDVRSARRFKVVGEQEAWLDEW